LCGIGGLVACGGSSEILPDNNTGPEEQLAVKGGTRPEGPRRRFTRQLGSGGSAQYAVNANLWRAALDTISFMPIASADPYGGAIITDWYAPPDTPNERFKVNVLVQGAELSSSGVKVTLFRQEKSGSGEWVDAATENSTSVDLENVILQRARELVQDRVNQ